MALGCGHLFHDNCIGRASEARGCHYIHLPCPVCRHTTRPIAEELDPFQEHVDNLFPVTPVEVDDSQSDMAVVAAAQADVPHVTQRWRPTTCR